MKVRVSKPQNQEITHLDKLGSKNTFTGLDPHFYMFPHEPLGLISLKIAIWSSEYRNGSIFPEKCIFCTLYSAVRPTRPV